MSHNNSKKILICSLAVIGLGSLVPAAWADTVNLDTFQGSGWTVTRGSDPTIGVVDVTTAFPLSAWIQSSTVNADQTSVDGLPHSANWVSTANDGGGHSDVNGQEYAYTDTFTLIPGIDGPSIFALSGTISSDNWIPTPTSPIPAADGITLTYVDGIGGSGSIPVTLIPGIGTPVGVLGQETMYQYAFAANASLPNFISPATFTLTVDVVNSFEDPNNGQNPGPTGLILAGTAVGIPGIGSVAVPLPSAAASGATMLGGLGVLAMLRKRLGRAAKLA